MGAVGGCMGAASIIYFRRSARAAEAASPPVAWRLDRIDGDHHQLVNVGTGTALQVHASVSNVAAVFGLESDRDVQSGARVLFSTVMAFQMDGPAHLLVSWGPATRRAMWESDLMPR